MTIQAMEEMRRLAGAQAKAVTCHPLGTCCGAVAWRQRSLQWVCVQSTMSLESTATIKAKLSAGLGSKAPRYWSTLQAFLSATISRTEFDEEIRQCVDTSQLGTNLPTLSCSLSRPPYLLLFCSPTAQCTHHLHI